MPEAGFVKVIAPAVVELVTAPDAAVGAMPAPGFPATVYRENEVAAPFVVAETLYKFKLCFAESSADVSWSRVVIAMSGYTFSQISFKEGFRGGALATVTGLVLPAPGTVTVTTPEAAVALTPAPMKLIVAAAVVIWVF